MKIKALTSAAILMASASSAMAAYQVTGSAVADASIWVFSQAEGIYTDTGGSTLDDNGILTINYHNDYNITAASSTAVFEGIMTVDLNNLTASYRNTSCLLTSGGVDPCGSAMVNEDNPANSVSIDTWNSSEIIFTTVDVASGATVTTDWTVAIGEEISEVPVPAAAWLFGSALLGLANIGRRKAK